MTADAVLPPLSFEMLQTQRVHGIGIPDLLHRLRTRVADDELAPPIQKAGRNQSVRIHRVAVEDVGAGIGVPDVLLIDAFADFHAGMLLDVELRPARRKVLDENAVAVIAEGVEELLPLRFGDELAGNFHDDLAASFIGINPFDVFDEALEVELEAGETQIGLLGHAVDRDIDLVDAGLEDRADALGGEEGAVGRGVDIFDVTRALGVSDHVGKALVEQRLAVFVHAQDLDRLVERAEVVDDLLKHLELHHALEAAGLRDKVAVAGGTKRAFEVAGARRIDEDDERRGERDDRFEGGAPLDIDARLEAGFHASRPTRQR